MKRIGWRKLTSVFGEIILIGFAAYKLIGLQANIASELRANWEAQLVLHDIFGKLQGVEMAKLSKHELALKQALGTKVTHCHASAKYGYQPMAWTLEGLTGIEDIQVTYGAIKEPCEKYRIEVKPGRVGRLEDTERKINRYELAVPVSVASIQDRVGIMVSAFFSKIR